MRAEQTPDIEAAFLADVSAVIRDYLTDETTAEIPGFHATALTHRLAPVLAAAVREAEQRALREAADALECPEYLRFGHETCCHACMKALWLRARADRVAEPQHEAATSGKESEASDE